MLQPMNLKANQRLNDVSQLTINENDSVKSYLALLCFGKSEFDAIESFRGNAFFMPALSLGAVASSPTLRQRLSDAHLSRIIKVDIKSELFIYDIDEHALTHACLMDGKLLLVTNTQN